MAASAAGVAAAVAAHRRKLISHFVTVGAVAPEKAVPPDSLPSVGFHMLERLKADKIIRVTPQGALYIDQARAAELQARREAIAIKIVVGSVLVTALAAGIAVFALRAAA